MQVSFETLLTLNKSIMLSRTGHEPIKQNFCRLFWNNYRFPSQILFTKRRTMLFRATFALKEKLAKNAISRSGQSLVTSLLSTECLKSLSSDRGRKWRRRLSSWSRLFRKSQIGLFRRLGALVVRRIQARANLQEARAILSPSTLSKNTLYWSKIYYMTQFKSLNLFFQLSKLIF